MFRGNALAAGCLALTALVVGPSVATAQLTFATFDSNQFNSNGFRFADFDDDFFGTFDASGGVISLDINNDFDLANGFFGGAGSDVAADFDAATTQLEVTYAVGPDNFATGFNIVLVDDDGLNDGGMASGEEYQYNVDIFGVTPADGFVTEIISLDSFGFRQAAFNQADGDMELNFGLRQIQVQSQFGVSDRLQVDIQSVKLVDPMGEPDPLLIELTPDTFAAQVGSFDFGSFQETGVVDQTGGTFVIDVNQAADPDASGGLGFSGLNLDFEATEYAIEVEAKLLPGNLAETFNVLMGDVDGDDSGPMLGSEDFNFNVPTNAFNDTDFTTFTIPLGSGSESSVVTTFGFTNGGDGLQNFDLSQLQIQTNNPEDGTGAGLAIEIARFSIVEIIDSGLPGDANGDGSVDLLDLDILGANFGTTEGGTVATGDFNGDGAVDLLDLDILGANFGTSTGSAIPEPTTLALAGLLAVGVIARRRS